VTLATTPTRGALVAELADVVGAPHEARFIVDEVLGLGLVLGYSDPPSGPLGEDAVAAARRMAARRAAGEPLQYVFGHWPFRTLDLLVDPRVLIPRPETELLVEVALSVRRGGRVVDVGTGSGAVALALKEERADLSVVGADLSSDALDVARANAEALGLDVEFVQADLLEGVPGPFDAVLANLPYVAEGSAVPPEIELYEPSLALFGGPDGMDIIRRLLTMTDNVPLVALEMGLGEAVAGLVSAAGFPSVEILPDLAGHERVVVGRR
jgi:release factor glutamine methyltransferase